MTGHRIWNVHFPNIKHTKEPHISVEVASKNIKKAPAHCMKPSYCISGTAAKCPRILFQHPLVQLTEIKI
jgi:hypothetical protein